MPTTVSREELVRVLDKSESVAKTEKVSGDPVCSISVVGNRLRVIANGLGIRIRAFVDCESDEDMDIVVPVSKFTSLVRLFTSTQVTISTGGTEENMLVFIKGDKSSYRMRCNRVDTVDPGIIGDVLFTVPSENFFGGMRSVSYATADPERSGSRPQLACVYVGIGPDGFSFAGGDSYRAAVSTLVQERDDEIEERFFLVPRDYVSLLSKMVDSGEVEIIGVSENEIGIKSGLVEVIASIFAYPYPYDAIVDLVKENDSDMLLEVTTSALLSAVNRLILVAGSSSPITSISFNETSLIMSSGSSDYGSGEEEVLAEFGGNKEFQSKSISFGILRLKDALSGISGEKVNLSFSFTRGLLTSKDSNVIHYMVPIFGGQ